MTDGSRSGVNLNQLVMADSVTAFAAGHDAPRPAQAQQGVDDIAPRMAGASSPGASSSRALEAAPENGGGRAPPAADLQWPHPRSAAAAAAAFQPAAPPAEDGHDALRKIAEATAALAAANANAAAAKERLAAAKAESAKSCRVPEGARGTAGDGLLSLPEASVR